MAGGSDYNFSLASVGFSGFPPPNEDGFVSSGGDFGEATDVNVNSARALTNASTPNTPPKATNSAFTTGLNLLFSDPTAFFNTLTGNDASSVPNAEVQQTATKSIGTNVASGPLNPLNLPTWVKVVIIGGVAIVGLSLLAIVTYEVKK